MSEPYPILEFDPTREAIIEPSRLIQPIDVAEHCVVCFFREVLDNLRQTRRPRVAKELISEMGREPLLELDWDGKPLAAFHPGVGAPLAAAMLEEVIASGCRKFIACGGCGVLDRDVACGHVVVPTSAVRDEGTSYHYLPPGREVPAGPEGVAAIEAALRQGGVPYVLGKTWTTDGFYRETPARIRRRRAEGCLTVEMEAAALFAVARFRGVTFAQVLYAGDDVSGDQWDHRDWQGRGGTRERLFALAAEACLRL